MGKTLTIEMLRKGISGPVWGLCDGEELILQFPAETEERALSYFVSQKETLNGSGYNQIKTSKGEIYRF